MNTAATSEAPSIRSNSKLCPDILFLTDCWPRGHVFGGQLRALHTGRALQKVGKVTLVVVTSDPVNQDTLNTCAQEFEVQPPILTQMCPPRPLVEKFQFLLNPKYLNLHGCIASPTDRDRIALSFNKFELIWLLHSRTANIIPIYKWSHSHLDVSDVTSTYYGNIAMRADNRLQRWRARIEQGAFRRRELLLKERFATLSVCSEADRHYLGGGEHVHVIPNGFERPKQEPVWNPVDPPRIGFIGLYSYSPNLEGMKWFLRECWPLVKHAIPDAHLRLVGKDTDGPLTPNAPDIDALGYVDDPADEMATWSAMIVPVIHGAGTRVKIAEGFSRKCPIISTGLGAYGYDVREGRELLLADDPRDFAAACVSLIRDRAAARAIAERAYAAFLEKWTWDAIAPRVWAAAEDALALARR